MRKSHPPNEGQIEEREKIEWKRRNFDDKLTSHELICNTLIPGSIFGIR